MGFGTTGGLTEPVFQQKGCYWAAVPAESKRIGLLVISLGCCTFIGHQGSPAGRTRNSPGIAKPWALGEKNYRHHQKI